MEHTLNPVVRGAIIISSKRILCFWLNILSLISTIKSILILVKLRVDLLKSFFFVYKSIGFGNLRFCGKPKSGNFSCNQYLYQWAEVKVCRRFIEKAYNICGLIIKTGIIFMASSSATVIIEILQACNFFFLLTTSTIRILALCLCDQWCLLTRSEKAGGFIYWMGAKAVHVSWRAGMSRSVASQVVFFFVFRWAV